MTSAGEQEADLAKRTPSNASTYQFDQAVVRVQISVNDAHGVQVSLQEGEARGEEEAPVVSMLSLSCCPGSLWFLSPLAAEQPKRRGTAQPKGYFGPWEGLLERQRREQPYIKKSPKSWGEKLWSEAMD